MLILTRKPGEAIQIGNDIEIVVCGLTQFQVRIGIAAPKDVRIVRRELAGREDGCSADTTGIPSPKETSS